MQALNKSALLENKVVTLQRQSENYIRKVEQEKKHYYNVEETHQIVLKEWMEKKGIMKEIQQTKSSPEWKLLQARVKNLEQDLEKAIGRLDQTQSTNEGLKKQIDFLRKQRSQWLKIEKTLDHQISETETTQHNLEEAIGAEQERTQDHRKNIIQLIKKNDSEKEVYVEQFDKLHQEVLEERKQSKLAARKDKNESIDIATLLKFRLKKLIANNKEKVRYIEHYMRNMKIIDEAFTQIKEVSGITDVEEIQNTFIKSEEQNYSLYEHVDKLCQEIDSHTAQNEDMKAKIKQQQKENDLKIQILRATPTVERERRKKNKILDSKKQQIDSMRIKMHEISSDLQQMLIQLAQTEFTRDQNAQYEYQLSFNLNESTLERYLQDLEFYLNILLSKQYKQVSGTVVSNLLLLDQIPQKEFRQQKVPQPMIANDEISIDQTKLFDKNRVKEQIIDTIEKKKKG